jgi:hypothetical protein
MTIPSERLRSTGLDDSSGPFGDETSYRDYRDRYRAMATSLGFEGHIAWAEAMP